MWHCEHCPYKARKQQSLKEHLKVVHQGVKDFHCPQCSRSFTRADHLKLHILRHEGIKKFKCAVCGLKKVSIGELNTHMNTHTKEKMWSCEYCSYKSPIPRNVSRHVKVVHDGKKDFHCPHCERSFGKAESLRNHVMTHTGEKPHACAELLAHMVTIAS
uniref:C2H2-type domain-containing protein n=1 Tax=Phlebotomus papatasi TaxID=29031 RepID=A0A1B0D3D5_PHLPP